MRRRFPSARTVVTLDVHTGLGPAGRDSMLLSTEDEVKARLRALRSFAPARLRAASRRLLRSASSRS
jgi:hypothetical protein